MWINHYPYEDYNPNKLVHKYFKEETIMAWKKVIVLTRPDVDTGFEHNSAEVKDHISTNYDDTGKRISFSLVTSEDALVLTYTSVYRDEASKNEFRNDSTILAEWRRRNGVNAANGITKELTVDEEV